MATAGCSRSLSLPVYVAAWMEQQFMNFVVSDIALLDLKDDTEITPSDWTPPQFSVYCIASVWATSEFLAKRECRAMCGVQRVPCLRSIYLRDKLRRLAVSLCRAASLNVE
eukprot:15425-Heterococcus_DN1.PRE.1